jgi:hypothetical protein
METDISLLYCLYGSEYRLFHSIFRNTRRGEWNEPMVLLKQIPEIICIQKDYHIGYMVLGPSVERLKTHQTLNFHNSPQKHIVL